MARRKKTEGRPLAQNSRVRSFKGAPQPRKRSRGAFMRNVWVTVLLSGLLYFTFSVVPEGDRQKVTEFVKERLIYGANGAPEPLPVEDVAGVGDAEAAGPQELADARTGSASGGGLSAFLGQFFQSPEGAESNSGGSGRIAITGFPRAYDDWSRTDYLNAEAAVLAMQTMDSTLGTAATQITPLEDVNKRIAAIYRDGGRSLMIFAEAPRFVAQPVPLASAAPSGVLAESEPQPSAQEAPPQATVVPVAATVEIALEDAVVGTALPEQVVEEISAEVASEDAATGLPEIELLGIIFSDHSGGKRGVLDLRATRQSGQTLILRGRVTTSVAAQFLEELKFANMFQGR